MPNTRAHMEKESFFIRPKANVGCLWHQGSSRGQLWFYCRNMISKYNTICIVSDLSAFCFVLSLLLDDFRVFCGDLGNEVTDEILTRTFSKYPSLLKAKVVRDKKTNKSKGYGFLSFKDPNDFVKAMREMNGKQCLCEVYITDYVRLLKQYIVV